MEKRGRRSGGPHSEHGKESSSGNAITHGGCANRLLVKDEKREDFDALEAWWFDNYDAELAGRPLIAEAALNEWLLKRAQRNQLAVEAPMGESDPNEWTEEQWHRLHLMTRYKTAAERSFHRSLGALERFRRTRYYEGLAEERAEERAEQKAHERKEQRKRDGAGEKKAAEPSTAEKYLALPPAVPTPALSQWVTVDVVDGRTVTDLWPSNEELLIESEINEPRPLRVFRDLLIKDWSAPEYGWVHESLPGRSATRLQVMRLEEWKRALEREKDLNGHLGAVEADESWLRRRDIYADKRTGQETERDGPGNPGTVGGGPGAEGTDSNGTDSGQRPAA